MALAMGSPRSLFWWGRNENYTVSESKLLFFSAKIARFQRFYRSYKPTNNTLWTAKISFSRFFFALRAGFVMTFWGAEIESAFCPLNGRFSALFDGFWSAPAFITGKGAVLKESLDSDTMYHSFNAIATCPFLKSRLPIAIKVEKCYRFTGSIHATNKLECR